MARIMDMLAMLLFLTFVVFVKRYFAAGRCSFHILPIGGNPVVLMHL